MQVNNAINAIYNYIHNSSKQLSSLNLSELYEYSFGNNQNEIIYIGCIGILNIGLVHYKLICNIIRVSS